MHSATTVLAALVSLAAAKGSRTFAVNHFYGTGPLTMGRMDPIISPGTASSHVHAIQGGSNFALTMSDGTLLDSNCTSSLVKNDKSNYWTPALYFQDPTTKELTSVELFYMNVYYFFEATDDEIKAFQPGHRMVIGDPSLRTPPAAGPELVTDLKYGTPQPVQWTCPRSNTAAPLYPKDSTGLNGVGIQDPGNAGAGSGFPDQNCDGYASPLRADIHFPSCYNPAAGLDNYHENMQFPSSVGASAGKANCPPGWIHTPHIFYEVYWNTPKFASQWTPGQGTQPFVLANGDPTGYSLHADFISGWDVATLQQIIDNCDAGDSGMDKCPGLIGGLNDPSTSCNINNLVPEVISGSMSVLPGNNLVSGWGTDVVAPAASAVAPVSSAAATLASSTHSTSSTSTSTTTTSHTISTTTALTTMKVVPTSASASSAGAVFIESPTTTASSAAPTATDDGNDDDSCEADQAVPTSPVSGWTYTGCYADLKPLRVLTGIEFANIGQHAATNTKCINYCGAQGYSIAGTEYGGQCFCGNSLGSSAKLDESKCQMACEGDGTQLCGGSASLSAYSTTPSTKRDEIPEMVKEERRARHVHRHLGRSPVAIRDASC